MKFRRLLALSLFLPLLSCTFFTLVPSGSSTTVKDAYTVKAETAWNAHNFSDAILWTQHGLGLDQLFFFAPAEDGKPLVTASQATGGKQPPPFKKNMNLLELPDLMKGTLIAIGYVEVTKDTVQQGTLGGNKALRMDFLAKTENGPDMKGFAIMSIKGERLYAVAFTAEETAYHPLVAPSTEKIVAGLSLAN